MAIRGRERGAVWPLAVIRGQQSVRQWCPTPGAGERQRALCPLKRSGGPRVPVARCDARRWIDGKPSSVGTGLSSRAARCRDDHLSRGRRLPGDRSPPRERQGATKYPEAAPIRGRTGAGQATRLLFCLAPHGVFRAPAFARAGGELLPRLFTLTRPVTGPGGLFSVTLSVAAGLRRTAPACSTRHVALRCSDFPLAGQGTVRASPAASDHLSIRRRP